MNEVNILKAYVETMEKQVKIGMGFIIQMGTINGCEFKALARIAKDCSSLNTSIRLMNYIIEDLEAGLEEEA